MNFILLKKKTLLNRYTNKWLVSNLFCFVRSSMWTSKVKSENYVARCQVVPSVSSKVYWIFYRVSQCIKRFRFPFHEMNDFTKWMWHFDSVNKYAISYLRQKLCHQCRFYFWYSTSWLVSSIMINGLRKLYRGLHKIIYTT